MTSSEKLKLDLELLELRKIELEFKIVETRNRILAEQMIEKKEPSAAEKWCHDRLSLGRHTPENIFWFTECHEAGQKHQAEVERERVKPLIERAKNAVIALREHKPMHVDGQLLAQALKNLEENEHTVDINELEGTVYSITNDGTGYMDDKQTRITFIVDGWPNIRPLSKFKLTPIKD